MAVARIVVQLRQIGRYLGEMPAFAACHDRIDGAHVVDCIAVADGARAAAVVTDHAAEGGATSSRGVDRKEKPMRPEMGIELIEHDTGLDAYATRLNVQMQDLV